MRACTDHRSFVLPYLGNWSKVFVGVNIAVAGKFTMRKHLNLLAVLALIFTAAAQSGAQQTPKPVVDEDAAVVKAMRIIVHAEIIYFSTFPQVGFTCSLSDLGGSGVQPSERHAVLISGDLADGKRNGFVYRLSGCSRTPAINFRVSATAEAEGSGRRAFCADESGTIRYSADGNPATCFASGTRAQ
jgi:type IV pilus assembly protein PilA